MHAAISNRPRASVIALPPEPCEVRDNELENLLSMILCDVRSVDDGKSSIIRSANEPEEPVSICSSESLCLPEPPRQEPCELERVCLWLRGSDPNLVIARARWVSHRTRQRVELSDPLEHSLSEPWIGALCSA